MTQSDEHKSRKICLLGASAVGKTSLVRRFVYGIFDETYETTIGCHIVDNSVSVDGTQVTLNIWDLEGKDDPRSEYDTTYLAGAEGYMLVADVARPDTLDVAKDLLSIIVRHRKEERVKKEGVLVEVLEEDDPPFVLLLNKQDLHPSREATARAFEGLVDDSKIFKTSAKKDHMENEPFHHMVNEAFQCLTQQMLEVDRQKNKEGGETTNL